jgi:hypothetical protein
MSNKPLNELDWRTLLWEDTPTTTLDGADHGDSTEDVVVDEDDDHHSRRRRERRIDPLHRPMPVRA